jgi:CHAD domain-containing protein
MARFEKWLTNATPDAPVDRVARNALQTRLRAVMHFLAAVGGSQRRPEAIHQLRIWTRRAGAALRLFRPAIPKRRRKWIEKALRSIRRTAGVVRDCDVHLARLAAEGDPPRSLVALLKRQRRTARKELKALRRRLQKDNRLERKAARLLNEIAWPKRHSTRAAPAFRTWCRQQIAPLGAAFFALAAGELAADRQFHALRIAGKRLRYGLELAATAMPPRAHRQLHDELIAVQDRLGEVCDHMVAVGRLRNWIAAARKSGQRRKLAALLDREQAHLAASRRRFLDWWSPTRRARFQDHWETALAT